MELYARNIIPVVLSGQCLVWQANKPPVVAQRISGTSKVKLKQICQKSKFLDAKNSLMSCSICGLAGTHCLAKMYKWNASFLWYDYVIHGNRIRVIVPWKMWIEFLQTCFNETVVNWDSGCWVLYRTTSMKQHFFRFTSGKVMKINFLNNNSFHSSATKGVEDTAKIESLVSIIDIKNVEMLKKEDMARHAIIAILLAFCSRVFGGLRKRLCTLHAFNRLKPLLFLVTGIHDWIPWMTFLSGLFNFLLIKEFYLWRYGAPESWVTHHGLNYSGIGNMPSKNFCKK